jgi:K+-transporting ATPase ATPase C chain
MLPHLRPALVLLFLFTILTGLAYPLAITGVAQMIWPFEANGSPSLRNNQLIGSDLIGQNFTSDRYFHGRPSSTNQPDPNDTSQTIDAPYNAANSMGSNYGATSQKLIDRVKASLEVLGKDGIAKDVPADAVTSSASGLDPHISPAFAQAQVARLAKVRHVSEASLQALVDANTEGRLFGFFGEARVNVLRLNVALDSIH